MIKCPSCSTELADDADRCPKCAKDIRKYIEEQGGLEAYLKKRNASEMKGCLWTLGVIALIFLAVYLSSTNDSDYDRCDEIVKETPWDSDAYLKCRDPEKYNREDVEKFLKWNEKQQHPWRDN